MRDDGRVTIDREGAVAILTLERPLRRNALAGRMREELASHLGVIANDPAIGAIVLRGAGEAFCSGTDLEHLAALADEPDGEQRLSQMLDVDTEIVLKLACEVRKPTLAAIYGAAVGAGLGLALVCDYRLCSENSRLSTGFARAGLGPDWGASYFLPERVGRARALDLMLRSPELGAMEALAIGLVDEVAPAARHEQRWREHARSWADVPPVAQAAILDSMRCVDRQALVAALAQEREAQLACFRTEASRSRIAQLLGRRRHDPT